MMPQNFDKVYSKMSPEERSVVDAIMAANRMDEKGLIDSIIGDVQQRNARFFDIIYVDLSIDRSTNPLQISGGGTILAGAEATDNVAECTVSFETEDRDTNRRFTLKRGKRFFGPFSRFYIYHAAQSGKYLKILRGVETRSVRVGMEDDSGESANSDLVTALGNSSAISTGQVSVTNAATVIKAANSSRKRIVIKNPATNSAPVFIGAVGVAANTGHQLDPGDAITLNTTAAVYGIHSTVTQTITYLEE